MKSKIEVSLLGPFAVSDLDGAPVKIGTRKAEALLAMLFLSKTGSRSRTWLMEMLWHDRAREQASGSLRQTLSVIRRASRNISDNLKTDRKEIRLVRDAFDVDVWDDAEVERARIRGDVLLEGFDIASEPFEEWLRQERADFATEAAANLRQALPIGHDLPRLLAPNANLPETDQRLIAKDFGGLYTVYRKGSGNLAALRELMVISRSRDGAARLAMLTHNQKLYQGVIWRSGSILQCALFREDRRFGFSTRFLSLSGAQRGSAKTISGLMLHVTHRLGRPVASNLVAVRDRNHTEVEALFDKHGDLKSDELSDLLPMNFRPRRFNSMEDLGSSELRYVDLIENPQIALSQDTLIEFE